MTNNKPFMKIPEAAKATGLSTYFLRHGVIDGSIPHVKSGKTYYINVPALLQHGGGAQKCLSARKPHFGAASTKTGQRRKRLASHSPESHYEAMCEKNSDNSFTQTLFPAFAG